MGAEHRNLTIVGKTFKQAWSDAVDEDNHERGHDYYNGSIDSIHNIKEVKYSDDFEEYSRGSKYLDKCTAVVFCTRKPTVNKNKIKTEVTRHPQKGARKWVTKYCIYRGHNEECIKKFDYQDKAIAHARSLSEKDGYRYNIYIEKQLEKGNQLVAEIKYKKAKNEENGRWDVVACVPC